MSKFEEDISKFLSGSLATKDKYHRRLLVFASEYNGRGLGVFGSNNIELFEEEYNNGVMSRLYESMPYKVMCMRYEIDYIGPWKALAEAQ